MDKEQQLRDRLDKNLSDYRRQVFSMWKHEIIEMAGRITAMSDAHYYLQNHHEFEPEQVEYLLKLEKPLDLLANAWQKRTEDISDMSFALDEVFSSQEKLGDYLSYTASNRKNPSAKKMSDINKNRLR